MYGSSTHVEQEKGCAYQALATPLKQQCFPCLRKLQPRFAQGSIWTKELDRTIESFARINVVWKVEKAQYAEFNVPTSGKIAVWQLCRERQPFWNHDGLNLTYSDQCHGVLWLTPKNCYQLYSLNLIDEFTSLFSPKVIVAGLPRESLSCLCGHQCFSVVAHQDSPKASPRAFLKWKNLKEPLKLLS